MASMGDIKDSLKPVKIVDFETVQMEGREQDIMSLENSPGWKGVVKELQSQVASIEADIFDINNGLTNDQRKEKIIERFYLVKLIGLPKEKRELFLLRKEENILSEEI